MPGNAASTVNNTRRSSIALPARHGRQPGLRLNLIFLVLAFYRLFKGMGWNPAVLVVMFGGVMPALRLVGHGLNSDGAIQIRSCRFAIPLVFMRSGGQRAKR
jgi:hypothetical protein